MVMAAQTPILLQVGLSPPCLPAFSAPCRCGLCLCRPTRTLFDALYNLLHSPNLCDVALLATDDDSFDAKPRLKTCRIAPICGMSLSLPAYLTPWQVSIAPTIGATFTHIPAAKIDIKERSR